MNNLLFTLNGEKVSYHDAITTALVRDQFDLVAQSQEAVILRQLAKEKNLEIPSEMAQAELDGWREEMLLEQAGETDRWMELNRISPDGMRLAAESMAAARILRSSFGQDELRAFYDEISDSFHTVDMLIFDTADTETGEDLARKLRVESWKFGDLIRAIRATEKIAIDVSHNMPRQDVEDAFSMDPFDLEIGDVSGPYDFEGIATYIVLISKNRPAFEEVEEDIRNALLNDIIEQRLRSSYLVRNYAGEKD